MTKKYQVFISSTFDDLKEQRDAVVKAVLQLGHLPVGMEMFDAGDQTQWETIRSYIDSSDYYVVILAHRYGTKKYGVSYTEKEYRYAGKQGIPRLGFVIEKGATWPANLIEMEAKKELDAFKSTVGKARVIKFWDTTDKLALQVSQALNHQINTNPRIGWVRATEAASPQVAEELTRLSKENKKLRDQLLQAQPVDETTELQRIIEKEVISFPIDESSIDVSLKEILLAVAQLSNNPYPRFIHNFILAEKSSQEVNQNTFPRDMSAIEKGLEDLLRIGLLTANNDGPGGAWHMTEKGERLYVRLRSQSQD